ncbi:glycosyltransferase family 2 protein [Streptococcus catagoni]|uniref:glycosyltransferase family 2 protein n=1 Tax=Streptococcus catagoni TaxID=2654874 RepID=UPI00140D7DEC|nr:glycosyltransferase family 2 protein [Streptococcus catagoni]
MAAISEKPKVMICLATYNAEKYLPEQMDSLLSQTYSNWVCKIRDDGSTDQTLSIINDYCKKDPRFDFINPRERNNLGSHRSFYELVKCAQADYYFFCDQDDVWKDNKIEVFLARVGKDTNEPTLVYSTWTSVDENLNFLSENDAQTQINEQIAFNQINGMSIMINHPLATIWKYKDWGSHDSYISLLALAVGEIIYIPESTILWRRQKKSESIENYGRKYGLKTFWEMMNASFVRADLILKDYSELMQDDRKTFFQQFVDLSDANFIKRASLLGTLKLRRKSLLETLSMNILLLTNFGRTSNKEEK